MGRQSYLSNVAEDVVGKSSPRKCATGSIATPSSTMNKLRLREAEAARTVLLRTQKQAPKHPGVLSAASANLSSTAQFIVSDRTGQSIVGSVLSLTIDLIVFYFFILFVLCCSTIESNLLCNLTCCRYLHLYFNCVLV